MDQERLEFTKNLALAAGELTLEGYGRCGQMPKEGKDGYDIATEYDFRTEALVRERLAAEFGEPVLGEEDGLLGDRGAAQNGLWIVDPIDGTFNYQRGLPLYGVSIAYCRDGLPVCGAIYLPVLRQLFYATRGTGAYVVEGEGTAPRPIRVSQEREPRRLIVSLAGENVCGLATACAREGIPWRSLRFYLTAVVSLAYVASGQLDVFGDIALNLWDCAAGDILLREAGGPPTCDAAGTPIFPTYVRRRLELGDTAKFGFVATSNPELQASMQRVISAANLGPRD
jgi:myo-inositol-1(or 4)-monophosphatase